MLTKIIGRVVVAITAVSMAQAAYAQSSTTLRDPLIPGSLSAPPFVTVPNNRPPAPGEGPIPAPVTPGQGGPSTLLPWVPAVPSNQIDLTNSGLALPYNPTAALPPGVLGPLLTPNVPNEPSTPGYDPGMLNTAPYANTFNPAAYSPVLPGGGLPGVGGYASTIPNLRRGGQETHQWELRGRNSSLTGAGDGSQDQVTRMGPAAGWGVPFGVPTGYQFTQQDPFVPGAGGVVPRNNSIDLGGGMRYGGGPHTPTSTGSTIQDFGDSAMRGNPVEGLTAHQSTEFGQGWRRISLPNDNTTGTQLQSNKTTDFGFPFTQFNQNNVPDQATGQRLPPTAVITNF